MPIGRVVLRSVPIGSMMNTRHDQHPIPSRGLFAPAPELRAMVWWGTLTGALLGMAGGAAHWLWSDSTPGIRAISPAAPSVLESGAPPEPLSSAPPVQAPIQSNSTPQLSSRSLPSPEKAKPMKKNTIEPLPSSNPSVDEPNPIQKAPKETQPSPSELPYLF